MTTNPQIKQEIKNYIEKQLEEKLKTIQIKYLKENFLTRDEFLDALERIDKRFEAIQKQMNKRFDRVDKRFESIDKRFDRVYERFDNIDLGYGIVVEGLQYSVVKREFKLRGFELDLQVRQHFSDENFTVHPDTKDVEVDIFHVNPNIIGEASLKITNLDKLRTFIKKIEFIEKMYKEPFQRYLFCFKIDEKILGDIKNLLQKYNIELINPYLDH